jgi:phage shock protein PspC (stress-responsive transcriptional regulator)
MKSTVKVSISGIAFNLDNDAYSCLKSYLDRMETLFSGKEGGREIIEDIEVRIAELLSARIQSPAQIITLATVSEVIGTVGSADDIAGGEETAAFAQEHFRAQEPDRKRLFRDIDHRVIGGVCSGLGNYFGIDRVFVRLAFAIAAAFFIFWQEYHLPSFFRMAASSLILLYIILLIVMPAARTMKEKMAMRKEPISPAPPLRNEERMYAKAAHEGDFGRVLGKIIVIFCRIVAGFALAIVAFVALTLLVALPVGLITGNAVVGGWGVPEIADYLRASTSIPLWVVITLLMLLVCLPLLGLIYLLSKVLFKFKTKIRMGLVLFIVWLVALFSLAGIGICVAAENPDFPRDITTENSRDTLSEKRMLEPFKSLSVSGNFEVTAIPADSNYMVIHAAENYLPHIRTETNNGRLKIYWDKFRMRRWTRPHIYLYCTDWKNVEELRLSGATKFTCTDTLKAKTFFAGISGASAIAIVVDNGRTKLDVNGASKIDVAGRTGDFIADVSGASKITADMTAGKVALELSGASNLSLSGTAAHADFKITGASKTNAAGFAADTVIVRLSGSSKLSIHANKYLDVHASGASLIEYAGEPVTDINTSGAAKIRRIRN